jgi:integrase
VLGLKWGRADLDRGLVRVEQRFYRSELAEPRTDGSKRTLPLGILRDELRQIRPSDAHDHDFVFQRDAKLFNDRAILRDCIRPAAKRLGIYFDGFGWHTLRRENLTLLQEEAATVFEAQAQTGHSKSAMTGQYTLVDMDRREQVVLQVQRRLFGPARSSEAA